MRRKDGYRFSDIREDVGACASIIAGYFFENGIELSVQVATALLYGIKMDTHNMTRSVSELDLAMFSRLYPMADQGHIKLLDNFCLKLSDLEAYRTAIDTLHVKFSVRSEVECYDASDMIADALKGLGDGGGHADMAAGFIPNVPDENMAVDYAAVVEGRFLERVHG